MVPERWPLARLSFSLQTCVDHLDRVLAGCCWEVQATRTTPSESLLSLHQVAKCLTMKLAVHLAKEVAAILRAVLTHETKKLYNDSTVHLLALITGYSRQTRKYCTHRPDTMLPKEKGNDPAVAWHGLQRTLNHPNSGSHRLPALASVTGLEVLVMRIPLVIPQGAAPFCLNTPAMTPCCNVGSAARYGSTGNYPINFNGAC